MDFGGASDIGRKRGKNEDSYCLEQRSDGLLMAVADGVGGYLGGEIASAIAVQTVRSRLRMTDAPLEAALREAVDAANQRVLETAAARPAVRHMATTLTVAILADTRLVWGHVGDSRAYLWHRQALQLLTHDHSVAGELVASGVLAFDDVRFHPQRHVLTRSLGVSETLDVEVGSVPVQSGDWVLLTTDGLTAVLGGEELAEAVRGGSIDGPQALCQALVALANARGGPDNVTILAASA